jgi:hypothetical protein
MVLETLRSEIKDCMDNEKRYNILCKIIHEEYYKMFPHDNRAIDRTRADYPAFLLEGILNKEWWEDENTANW